MYQKIKETYQTLRKEGTSKVWISLLSTILGDIQKIEKDKGTVTNEQIVALLKKYRETAHQNVEYGVPNAPEELHILDGMLPKQMTADEVKHAVEGFVANNPSANLGQIMAHMKKTYNGCYDGAIASKAAAAIINRA